jgi:hypothetical protein
MSIRQAFALAWQYPVCRALLCVVAMNMLAWQAASAQNARQDQPATFTLSQEQGNCKPVTGFGAHFPPGSTVFVDGPLDPAKGTSVAPPGEDLHIEKHVAADGTFTAIFNPCPRRLVFPNAFPNTSFPVSDGADLMFAADNPQDEANGKGAMTYYTVSGLANARLPGTGVASNGVGTPPVMAMIHQPLCAIVLLIGAALVASGGCLLLFDRAQHREA